MRKSILSAIPLILLALPLCYGAPQQQPQQPQQPSVADAAKKSREQKKNQTKAAKVFTNDNLPGPGNAVNVVSGAPVPSADNASQPAAQPANPDAGSNAPAVGDDKAADGKQAKGEEFWRKRFAEARAKLKAAEKELDIMQRELNLMNQQYYSDPNKALRQQYDRSDINNRTKAINDKKDEIAKLKQAIADLEDELRQSGGNPGWAREP